VWKLEQQDIDDSKACRPSFFYLLTGIQLTPSVATAKNWFASMVVAELITPSEFNHDETRNIRHSSSSTLLQRVAILATQAVHPYAVVNVRLHSVPCAEPGGRNKRHDEPFSRFGFILAPS
jgi:hypothetical protein